MSKEKHARKFLDNYILLTIREDKESGELYPAIYKKDKFIKQLVRWKYGDDSQTINKEEDD